MSIVPFQVPQAVTFLQDALKTFQVEGWRELELAATRQLIQCYRSAGAGEEERLVRMLVRSAALNRGEHCQDESWLGQVESILQSTSKLCEWMLIAKQADIFLKPLKF